MEFEKELKDGIDILRISGRIEMPNLAELQEVLNDYLDTGGSKIVLNLREAQSINSSAVGAILDFFNKLQLAGRRLSLADLSSTCQRVLELTDLLDHLPIFATEDEAISSFK